MLNKFEMIVSHHHTLRYGIVFFVHGCHSAYYSLILVVVACCFWGGCVGGAHLHNAQPSAEEGSLGMVLCGRPPLHVLSGFGYAIFGGAVWEAPTSITHNPPAKEGSLGMVLCGRPPLHVCLVSDMRCFWGAVWEAPTSITHSPLQRRVP